MNSRQTEDGRSPQAGRATEIVVGLSVIVTPVGRWGLGDSYRAEVDALDNGRARVRPTHSKSRRARWVGLSQIQRQEA